MDALIEFLTTPSWTLLFVANVVVLLLAAPFMRIAKKNAKKGMKHDPHSGATTYAATTVAGWYIKPLSYGLLVLINGGVAWNMWLRREELNLDEMILAVSFAIVAIFFLMLVIKKLLVGMR